MKEAAVELKVAGQTYQVVTTAAKSELVRLATVVEGALREVTPDGRQPSPQALVLAAITLAHELEEEREKNRLLKTRHREVLSGLLERVDQVLEDGSHSDDSSFEEGRHESEPSLHESSPLTAVTSDQEASLRPVEVPIRRQHDHAVDRRG